MVLELLEWRTNRIYPQVVNSDVLRTQAGRAGRPKIINKTNEASKQTEHHQKHFIDKRGDATFNF